MDNTKDISYSGPDKEYIGYLDKTNYSNGLGGNSGVGQGYADIDFLVSELESFGTQVKGIYDLCVLEMLDYTVLIDSSNQTLVDSHAMSYPEDETPGSVSFQEYIYNYAVSTSTSSKYVNKYYENKIRGPFGTNALDIAHITRITYSEIGRIQNFLNEYTGEIDEPTEFRVIEAFQDWIQNAKNLINGFGQAFSQKAITSIPENEMAEIDEEKSREFQALFQSKLNIINSSISDLIGQTYKEWDDPSNVFYKNILGPSLKFNLNVTKKVGGGLDPDKTPLLYQEAQGSSLGFNAQFQAALSDQIKRNNLYYELLESVFNNIMQRDAYVKYISQLSQKGKVLPTSFITQLKDEPTVIAENKKVLESPEIPNYSQNSSSDHSYITGRESADAHPQYLLKDGGGSLVGSYDFTGDLFVNEANLKEILTVKDGQSKVLSYAIDWDTVSSEDTGGAGDLFSPKSLRILDLDVRPDNKVRYTLGFKIEDDSVSNYEFEIIEI